MLRLKNLSDRQREVLIRISLIGFCLGLWFGVLYTFIIVFLLLAWRLDDRAATFRQLVKEPLVQALLVLCGALILGLSWSETPLEGRHKWTKYLLLLVYVPFLALLNKQRLPWVIGAVLTGYCLVLSMGLYEWMVEKQQGVPAFNMSYLTFSAMLGVGSILSCCFACISRNKAVRIILAVASLILLYLQFHQSARGFLLATLLTLLVIMVIYFKITLRTLAGTALSVLVVSLFFAYASPIVQERWTQAEHDFENIQQGNYSSSIGYRLALWDVGLHGIGEKPFWGHGTGMPEHYFDHVILAYKNGIYSGLPEFQQTSHYHNDWIEIGMHLGLIGMLSLAFVLWAWYRTFKRCGLIYVGIGMVSFVVLSGLTETFLVFGRIPVLLLTITAIMVSWQKETEMLNAARKDKIGTGIGKIGTGIGFR